MHLPRAYSCSQQSDVDVQVYNLSDNAFSGTFPSLASPAKSLTALDVSGNGMTGAA